MATNFRFTLSGSRTLVTSAILAAVVAPALAQTQPAAVPVPFVTSAAGNGTGTVSASCTTGIVNTDNVNYGDGCPATAVRLSSPQGATVDKFGNIYIGDYSDRQVRVVYNGGAALAAAITAANSGYTTLTRPAPAPTPVVGNMYTLAGTGVTTTALTATAADGKYACANNAVVGQPEALNSLGDGCPAASAPVGPRDVALDADGNVFITDYTDSRIRIFCVNCATSTLAAQLITLENPGVTPVNGAMYTVVGFAGGYRDAAIGFGSATAATATVALLRSPTTAAVSSADDVYIADNTNNAVRVLYNGGAAARNILVAQGIAAPVQGYVYTIAGAGCVSAAAGKTGSVTSANSCLTTTGTDTPTLGNAVGLNVAWAVYLDPNGNVFYTDAGNARVKVIAGGVAAPSTLPSATAAGFTYSYAGQGTAAVGTVNGVAPSAIAFTAATGAQGVGGDNNGNIFMLDFGNGFIYETYAQTGITAIIGGGNAIATAAAGAYCNGGTTGPQMTDAFYNGCPATQVKLSSPRGPIVADNSGTLYFGDSVGTFVRRFSYNPTFPSTAVAATSTSQPYAFTFLSAQTLAAPTVTVRGATAAGFADAITGDTCTTGLAAAAGAPGTTCVVNVNFTPQRPGLTTGAVELRSATGVLGETLFSGTGLGAGLNVDPGATTTVGTGLSPNGITIDGAGRVLVTDITSKSLLRYTAGVAATVATGFNVPSGVAIDGAGNIFVADSAANTITEIPLIGARFTFASGLNSPRNLAIDGVGNLYVADSGNNRVLQYGPGASVPSVVGFTGLAAPAAVAVDAAGNIYAGDTTHIVKLTPGGVQTTSVSTTLNTALAVDAAGNLFATTAGNLTEFPASGAAGFTLATFTTPRGLAIDGSGNLYVADNARTGYVSLQRTAAAYAFTAYPASTTITLTSSGNAPLTAPTYTQTDTVDFSLTPATTNGCSGALAAGTACSLTASFNPVTAGALSDVVTFNSNATNGTPITLTLTGTVTAQPTTTALTVSPATLVYGNVETLTATVSGTISTPTAGTVNFYNNLTTLLGSATVGAGGVATLNLVPPVGTYSVTATFVPSGLTFTTSTSTAKTFTVTPAALTVTANNASKVVGAANPAFTYSITGFVNNDTQASATTGQPSETTTATTASPAGSYPITITQGTLAAANYTFTFVNGMLTVSGSTAQTITFGALPGVTYGVAPITLTATASSGLPVSYTVTGPATVSGSTLTITGAGNVSVTANQVGNSTYAAAAPVTQSFVVAKAPLTVTATSVSRVYGSANPALSYTITGFVNTDSQVTATSGAPAESTTAVASSNVGTYPITITAGTLASANYSFTFINGTLTVTPATLTATANNATRVYGAANPTFTGTLAGAVNNDVLTETFTTSATTASPAGTYAIVPGAAGTNVGNYTVAATNGTLTITQAKPAITISTSATTGFSGATSITLTATLTSPTSGTPTGTVTFLSGTTVVGTATISGNTAVLTTTALPVGTDSVTAVYNGDTNFSTATSSAISIVIAAGFSLTSSSTALAFQPGYQEAQAFLTVNPGGRTDNLTFACQGLPAKITCTFNPSTLSLSGLTTPQTVQLLVSNSSAKASVAPFPAQGSSAAKTIALAAGLPFAALFLFSLRRRRLPMLLLLALLGLGAATGLSGCGTTAADVSQGSGSYPFTLTVSSGSTVLQTINYTLTIP